MSEAVSPPGPVRVILLLARVALRRWLNRTSSSFRRKKTIEGVPVRTGTARKQSGGFGIALLGILFMIYGFFLSWQFLNTVGLHVEEYLSTGSIPLQQSTYDALLEMPPEIQGEARRSQVKALLLKDSNLYRTTLSNGGRELNRWLELYDSKGIAAFHPVAQTVHEDFGWLHPRYRSESLRTVGLFLFILALSQIWLGLGNGNQDLGRVEWSLEWLFTFPTPAGRLFLAKVFESTLINPIGWFWIMPFLAVLYFTAGMGAAGVLVGVVAMLYLGLLLSSVKVVVETWLRMMMSLDRLKNVQAISTLIGTFLWLAVLGIALTRTAPGFFYSLVRYVPAAALWNPLTIPVLLCGEGRTPLVAGAAMAAFAVVIPLAAVALCRRLVRDGLLTTSGTFQGVRRVPGTPTAPERRRLFHGVLAKDLRLLLRDRNFLVNTLVVPVGIFGFQMVLNPGLVQGVTGDYRHAATLAYGLGAYVLMSSAFQVLSVEGPALWLLYTFPREIHTILVRKTVLWAAVALIYALSVLGVTAALNRSLDWDALPLAVTAAVGVVITAFIAGALGTLGIDPLQTEPQKKARAEIIYLYLLLSSMYGYAIYGPSAWARLVQVILMALLVLALWQKVKDRLPYLLDPTESPPPTISLSDGLIATLAFFAIQGFMTILLLMSQTPLPLTLLISYGTAGGLVTFFTLVLFWRQKVPNLLEALGLSAPGRPILKAVGLGIAAGVAAGTLGLLYLRLVDRFEPLRLMKEEQMTLAKGVQIGGLWISLLAIGTAPFFEEYLFRGLVFKGLRRMLKPAYAVLASAAIFAIVHPPFSFVPVFGLGVAAALAFEGSGRLIAPILTHVIYNSVVVFLNR